MSSYDNYEHTGFLGRYEFGPGKYFVFFYGGINHASFFVKYLVIGRFVFVFIYLFILGF